MLFGSVFQELQFYAHTTGNMALKATGKKFVISDSSVNVYNMRMMTSGYDMAEYAKNPIGYYGHKPDDGVLLRWEDIHLDGDQVIAYPSVNMDHPRGERTYNEIIDGLLNSASVGKLCIKEYHLEDNAADPENPIIVVTNWYNKETSVVDNPANRNAMKAELYDGEGNEINLDELTIDLKNKLKDMAKITIPVTPELLSLLNLGDDATADAVIKGIQGLSDENKTLTTNLEKANTDIATERKNTAAARIKTILDKGLEDKKFNVATRNKLEKQFAELPDQLEDLVKDMTPMPSVVDALQQNTDGLPKELADKSYDDLHRMGRLAEVRDGYPEEYKKLYKAKHGREPKVEKAK